MDDKDRLIIETLLENARTPKTKIAEKLKVSEASIRKRISKLEKEGIIIGYKAVINYRLAKLSSSLTGVDVEPEKLLEVVEELKKILEIKSIWLTTGDHMIMLEIVSKSVEDLSKAHEKLYKIDGIRRVCPSIILDVLK